MSGDELKNLLLANDFVLSEIADKMGISPQALHSKLKAQSLRSDFITEVEEAINRTVDELRSGAKEGVDFDGLQDQPTSHLLSDTFTPVELGVMFTMGISYQTTLMDPENIQRLIETRETRLPFLYDEIERLLQLKELKKPHRRG